jgi:hypothetical protein
MVRGGAGTPERLDRLTARAVAHYAARRKREPKKITERTGPSAKAAGVAAALRKSDVPMGEMISLLPSAKLGSVIRGRP